MNSAAGKSRVVPRCMPDGRTAVAAWLLLIVAALPVCRAAGNILPVAAAAAVGLGGIVVTQRRRGAWLNDTAANVAVFLVGVLSAVEWLSFGLPEMYAISHCLLYAGTVKCWQMASARDLGHVVVLSVLLLLAGAVSTAQVLYGVSMLLSLWLGLYVLMGWSVLKDREGFSALMAEVGGAGSRSGVPSVRGLWRVCSAAAVFVLAVGFIVFVTFPRFRTPLRPAVSRSTAVTAFSARSSLGEIARLKRSDRVAMRVRLSLAGQPFGSEAYKPYFRGAVYEYYDGVRWISPKRQKAVRLVLPGDGSLHRLANVSLEALPGAVEQEYWLNPSSGILFAMHVPVGVGSEELDSVLYEPDSGVLRVNGPVPPAVHYKVLSAPPNFIVSKTVDYESPESIRQVAQRLRRYGQALVRSVMGESGDRASRSDMPPCYRPLVSRKVYDLAMSLAREVGDPANPADFEAIVNRFVRYLSSGQFTYTTEPGTVRRRYRAMERFLFETKRGHCEYFATALAVLCQCVGIPARYVSGYCGGQYNEVGGFYAVRDSDAHSWVEVYLPDRGWVEFDPTPSGTSSLMASGWLDRLGGLLDYLQFQWVSWVIAYDIFHRQRLLGTFGPWPTSGAVGREDSLYRTLWMARQIVFGPETLSLLGRILYWTALAVLVGLVFYLFRQAGRQFVRWWMHRQQARTLRHKCLPCYETVMTALARLGYARQPSETPLEFARRVEAEMDLNSALTRFVGRYYAVRFGRLGADDLERSAERLVELLRHAGSGQRPTRRESGEDVRAQRF